MIGVNVPLTLTEELSLVSEHLGIEVKRAGTQQCSIQSISKIKCVNIKCLTGLYRAIIIERLGLEL